MGLNLNEMFPSKWLKAEDFEEGEQRTVTIKDVAYEELQNKGGKPESKPVVFFRDEKPMVLNKTNASIIGHLYGPDTDEWIGKKITLYTLEVDSFGDIVRAVRVRNVVPKFAPVNKNGAAAYPQEGQQEFEGASNYQTPASLSPQEMESLWSELQAEGKPFGILLKPLPSTVTLEQFQSWQLKAREQINSARAKAAQADDEDTDPFADE